MPHCRAEISDSISETGRRKKRQVAHHLGNAKRSIGSHSSSRSDSDSGSDDEHSFPSFSQANAARDGRRGSDSPTDRGHNDRQGPMLRGSSAPSRGRQDTKQQGYRSSDDDNDDDSQ